MTYGEIERELRRQVPEVRWSIDSAVDGLDGWRVIVVGERDGRTVRSEREVGPFVRDADYAALIGEAAREVAAVLAPRAPEFIDWLEVA